MADTFSFEEASQPAKKTFSFEDAKAPSPAPAKPQEKPQSMMDFVSGNLNKGASSLLGAPVDAAANVIDLAKAGIGYPISKITGHAPPAWTEPYNRREIPLSGANIERGMEKIGAINESATPRNQAQQYAALGLQMAPAFADPAARLAAPYVDSAIGAAGRLAKPVTAPIKAASERISTPVSNALDDLMGSKIPAAKAEAGAAARASVEGVASDATALAQSEAAHAKNMEEFRARLDSHLKDQVSNSSGEQVPNLDAQGKTLRGSITAAYDSAKAARKEAADIQFTEAKQAAALKEASGARVDTADIESQLAKMKSDAAGIPDIESKINDMLSSVKGRPVTTEAPKILLPDGSKQPAPQPMGKTFEQLEMTRRHLNDIAYSGSLEGYPAIIRSRARDIASQLDKSMQEFVPQFGKYKQEYAKASEPLHSLDTRLGKAITSTEGGLQGDAYLKVAHQDLPGRLFSKKDGVELVRDALAGGKNATPEARAAASKQVDTMVENWVLEDTLGKGMTGEKAGERIQAPQMRATLSAVPKVESQLTSRFNSRAALEARSADLKNSAQLAGKRSEAASAAADKMKQDIDNADILAKMPDAKSQSKALDGYLNTLARERNAGLISKEKYQATLDLVSRANTLEERTARARRIAGKIAGAGLAVAVGKEFLGH